MLERRLAVEGQAVRACGSLSPATPPTRGVRLTRPSVLALPAAEQRRVEQQHAARELGWRAAHIRLRKPPSEWPTRKAGSPALSPRAREVVQLLHQVRPVVGDGVLRVVPELVDGLAREAARCAGCLNSTA
jgi:hypothetical protein